MKTYLAQILVSNGMTFDLINRRLCHEHLLAQAPIQAVHLLECSTICDVCVTLQRDGYEKYRRLNRGCLSKLRRPSTVYIAGPMSGIPGHNRPAFIKMEHLLKSEGFQVLSPAHWEDGKPYEWYMHRDLELMLSATAIMMLAGWKNSKGATFEHQAAKMTGKQIVYESARARTRKQKGEK